MIEHQKVGDVSHGAAPQNPVDRPDDDYIASAPVSETGFLAHWEPPDGLPSLFMAKMRGTGSPRLTDGSRRCFVDALTMRISSTFRLLVLCPALAATFAVQAEEVIIEARRALTPPADPQYSEAAGNWQNSSVHTTAPGTTAGVGSRFNTTVGSSVTLRPNLQDSGVYLLGAAFPAPSSQSADIVVRIDLTGATLTNLSPTTTLVGGVLESTVFQRAGGSTNWRRIGTLVLDAGVSVPTITFTHIRGTLDSTTARFYSDAYRLVNTAEPCLTGLPSLTTVNGPLAAGQTTVLVPGVDTNATRVTVYANGFLIGQKVGGIVGGSEVEAVTTTTPLVAGEIITVTQHDTNGVESCRPNTGSVVGGGPNPQVRVSFSLRMDSTLTGPIGAEGTSASAWLVMLGATGPASGFGTAPLGGTVLQPSTCWQTVTYNFAGSDSRYTWAGAGSTPGQFALLDSIALSMHAPRDSGPYAIYIDNIVNGSTLIEDFEIAPAGVADYSFNPPDFSGSTSGNLLSQPPGSITPNASVVTNLNADTGTNSAFVSWQFRDTSEGSWLRLVPLATAGGGSAPQVDLSQPISIRFLVLPVGQTAGEFQVAALGRRAVPPGGDIILEAPVIKGEGPTTYQWRFNGQDLPFENASTLVLGGVQPEHSGNYSVVVTSPNCSTESFGRVVVEETVLPATLSNPQAQQGGTFAFTLAGSPQRNYLIQASSDLASWTDVKTVTTDANGAIAVTDNPTEPHRFYRAVASPAP
jgi:hypothetical protein